MFFVHHTQIDRLWWMWQQENPSVRNMEYSGPQTQDKFDGTTPPQATVDDLLPMLGMADDLPVKDLLTTESDLLCYVY
jgi:tyrosinase